MREILFRAKRIDNNEWVEGLLTIMWGQYHIINPSDENTAYPIDCETICQYTGLNDKRGRKIFEGDILSGERYHDWGQGGEYVPDKCIIKWNEKQAAFDPIYWWKESIHNLEDYEVIGNILDNPELIKDAGK